MKKFKFFFKIIFLFTLIFLILEFFLFFLVHDSKKFDFSSNKKIIVKLFNLQYSEENKKSISKHSSIYHPFISWVHPPNSSIATGRSCQKDSVINTDNLGNSIVPINDENPDFNLVLTGASNAFGVGSSNNKNTMASLIQSEFAKKNKKVNVYNLSIRGSQSFQEFQRLYEFLTLNDKKINLVISFSVRNDADNAGRENDIKYSLHPKYSHDLSDKINKAFNHELYVNNVIFFKNKLTNNFYIFDVFYQNLKDLIIKKKKQEIAKSSKPLSYTNIERKISISANNYDLMFQASKIFGADYMLIPQPLSYTKKLTIEEKKCFNSLRYWENQFDKNSMEFQIAFYEKLFIKQKKIHFL